MKLGKWIIGLVVLLGAAYLFMRSSWGEMVKNKLGSMMPSLKNSPLASSAGAQIDVSTPEVLGTPDNMQTITGAAGPTSTPGRAVKK